MPLVSALEEFEECSVHWTQKSGWRVVPRSFVPEPGNKLQAVKAIAVNRKGLSEGVLLERLREVAGSLDFRWVVNLTITHKAYVEHRCGLWNLLHKPVYYGTPGSYMSEEDQRIEEITLDTVRAYKGVGQPKTQTRWDFPDCFILYAPERGYAVVSKDKQGLGVPHFLLRLSQLALKPPKERKIEVVVTHALGHIKKLGYWDIIVGQLFLSGRPALSLDIREVPGSPVFLVDIPASSRHTRKELV